MAKKLTAVSSDSSLSPLPEDIAAESETVVKESKTNGNKRKATSTAEKITKRTKTTLATKSKVEGTGAEITETAKPVRRVVKKAIVEEDTVEYEAKTEIDGEKKGKATTKTITKRSKKSRDDDNSDAEVDVKKKIPKRKPKAVNDGTPLAERTKDVKLRVGAHVSAAGG